MVCSTLQHHFTNARKRQAPVLGTHGSRWGCSALPSAVWIPSTAFRETTRQTGKLRGFPPLRFGNPLSISGWHPLTLLPSGCSAPCPPTTPSVGLPPSLVGLPPHTPPVASGIIGRKTPSCDGDFLPRGATAPHSANRQRKCREGYRPPSWGYRPTPHRTSALHPRTPSMARTFGAALYFRGVCSGFRAECP